MFDLGLIPSTSKEETSYVHVSSEPPSLNPNFTSTRAGNCFKSTFIVSFGFVASNVVFNSPTLTREAEENLEVVSTLLNEE